MSYTAQYDSLPFILRVVVQLLAGALVGGIYRIVRYTETRNVVTLVVGILALVTGVGNLIAWIVDLVTLVAYGKYTMFVD